MSIKEDVLRHWEAGTEKPTLRQAQELARILHIPFGYLFLSAPPQTVTPIADFRTLPTPEIGRFSPELEDTLNDALRKKDWLREWRLQEGLEPLSFVGRFSLRVSPEVVAENIREVLELQRMPPNNVRSWEDNLRFLINKAEAAGILILQNSVTLGDNRRRLSVEEFRGFTLVDTFAPVIFINSRDAVAGRIFTLAHELAHLWIGTGGVSNPQLNAADREPEIERACNQIAAELLVPKENFLQEWQAQSAADPLEKAQNLAVRFRVSVFVILIRSREMGLISYQTYQRAYTAALDKVEPPKENKDGQADFYNTWRVRNGRVLVKEMLQALRRGNILYREAAQLLNVRPATLERILAKF